MADNFLSGTLNRIVKLFFSVKEEKGFELNNPKKFLIVRQHNQLGDLLASISLFRAIKETYPDSQVTAVLSPFNFQGLTKNRFIDRILIFDKKQLHKPWYILKSISLLKENYDVAIVPVVVAISFTSNFIAALSDAKIKIGAKSLDGKENKSSYFFHKRIVLDWRMHPDSNVADRILDIVRPFGISTTNYRAEISFDEKDSASAKNFISSFSSKKELLIGLHVGAAKPQNRWGLDKYVSLIKKLNDNFEINFYLTGSDRDKDEISFVKKNLQIEVREFLNKPIPEVAALISFSDLFICNDTGIMHVAGTTQTAQISIFGPTNPFNWAPLGENKFFIRNSDLIDDISVEEVFLLSKQILKDKIHIVK
jgi:ADP-heptose:LPS heptosyltransferase